MGFMDKLKKAMGSKKGKAAEAEVVKKVEAEIRKEGASSDLGGQATTEAKDSGQSTLGE